MDKICFFGDESIGLILKGLGIDAFSGKNIEASFQDAYKKNLYSLIIVSEDLKDRILPIYLEMRKRFLPVVIFLPTKGKREEVSFKYIRRMIEKAVGVDILKKGEEE